MPNIVSRDLIEKYQSFAQEKFGFVFDDPMLLITAFTHRSYLNEHKKSTEEHNERLEFLGDAVLELVVTDFLFRNYQEPEGILTNWRSSLVRTESIGAASTRLGYLSYLRLSKGERGGSDRAKDQILANTFEAVIGAVYLDKGYEAARQIITDNILSTFDGILKSGSWRDPKSYLQEQAQKTDGFTPQYKVLSEDGPDHDKVFTIGVFVGKELRGTGTGSSKQSAQQASAQEALKYYQDKRC